MISRFFLIYQSIVPANYIKCSKAKKLTLKQFCDFFKDILCDGRPVISIKSLMFVSSSWIGNARSSYTVARYRNMVKFNSDWLGII